MDQEYTESKTFEKINFAINPLKKGEYENCQFKNCDLANSNLADIKFIECIFDGCNLSMAGFNKTVIHNIQFINCKILGLHFENCSEFGFSVSFDNCDLSLSSFYKTKLKKTLFKNSKLHEVDFTECDLSNCLFENCDFNRAIFSNTNIEKADFRTSFNYSLDPENNRIKKARFSLHGIAGLLDKYNIEID